MFRTLSVHRLLPLAVAVLVASWGVPSFAQSTGMVKGKVVDAEGKPVENARILIEFSEGMNRKYETKTNRRGEFIQIGLQPGNYRITADKDKLGVQTQEVRVVMGGSADVNFELNPNAARPLSKEEAAKLQAFKTAFDAGVAASNAGNHDEAITQFNAALAQQADCYACQFNIGGSYAQKKEYDRAEEAFKKAMAMKPEAAEPYNALANIYNSTRRFDEAAKMTEEATKRAGAGGADAAGGNPDQLFNQGVIFWNAGKIPDAKKQFEAALALNPSLADAHYWVGMANLNEGKLPEAATHFEEYIKLAPTGQYADQAKGVLSQIKK
jgi:tetratricopeptide (TPR) repeat protein